MQGLHSFSLKGKLELTNCFISKSQSFGKAESHKKTNLFKVPMKIPGRETIRLSGTKSHRRLCRIRWTEENEEFLLKFQLRRDG